MQNLFDLPQPPEGATCKKCKNIQRLECGGSILFYCAAIKDNRTENKLKKVKCKDKACVLFEAKIKEVKEKTLTYLQAVMVKFITDNGGYCTVRQVMYYFETIDLEGERISLRSTAVRVYVNLIQKRLLRRENDTLFLVEQNK